MSSITDTPATTVSRARSHTPVVDASPSLPPAPATAVPVTAGPETVVHIPAATTRSAWARPLRAAANIGQRLIAIGVLVNAHMHHADTTNQPSVR